MPALAIQGLRKTYDDGTEALKGVDLSIEEGEMTALLGANGAGKTTLINIVVGLAVKTAGRVSVFGVDQDKDPAASRTLIGIVPQEFNFNIFETVRDIIVTQGGYYGMNRRAAEANTDDLLRDLGLWEKRDAKSMTLSGGMKRRLMIARALVHRPRLLILDEPTAGVDVELRHSMWEYLHRLNASGTTVLLTTHYLEEVERLCRTMTIIRRGAVAKAGPVSKLVAESDGRRYRVTLSAEPNEMQLRILGAERVDGTIVRMELGFGEALDVIVAKAAEAELRVTDIAPAQNRIEELYLAALAA